MTLDDLDKRGGEMTNFAFIATFLGSVFFLISLPFLGVITMGSAPNMAKWCFAIGGLSNLAAAAWLLMG